MPFVVDLGGLEAKPTPCASFAPQPPELILAGWPESPERVADFRRIGWPVCSGLGGRFQPECSAKVLIEDWRIDYNINRPHSAHNWRSPAEFVEAWLHQQEQLQLA